MAAEAARIAFAALGVDAQAAVREQQRNRKLERHNRRQAVRTSSSTSAAAPGPAGAPAPAGTPLLEGCEYPDRLSRSDYFGAVPYGMYHRPDLRATPEHVTNLLSLAARDPGVGAHSYFLFGLGTSSAWNPAFNARLLWEGFFTITANLGVGGEPQPLPELQPFYSVLHWSYFERSPAVRKSLRRLVAQAASPDTGAGDSLEGEGGGAACGAAAGVRDGGYRLVVSKDVEASWRQLDRYQGERHSTNWMTLRYLRMLQAASADESVNLRLHAIELRRRAHGRGQSEQAGRVAELRASTGADVDVDDEEDSQGQAGGEEEDGGGGAGCEEVLAGEIGFSIGRVYTSLTGWTSQRSREGLGAAQLALLGRWLQGRGYAFWSMGHCYSPTMEYKRALGHRIYPRLDFLRLLARHRGPARLPGSVSSLLPQSAESGGQGGGGGSVDNEKRSEGIGGESGGGDGREEAPALFHPGMSALVTGLESRPELNGTKVTLDYSLEAHSRWQVLVEGGAPLRVRPANLRIVPPGAAGHAPSAVGLPQVEGGGCTASRQGQCGHEQAAMSWGRAAGTFRPLAEGDACDAELLLQGAMPAQADV